MPERAPARPRLRGVEQDPAWLRVILILAAAAVVGLLIVVPVVQVFAAALSGGLSVYWSNLVGDADTRHAILLTLRVVPAAVVANVAFGMAALATTAAGTTLRVRRMAWRVSASAKRLLQ